MATKKLTYILRPSLPRRAVVWFPQFENQRVIDEFRGSRDPLGNLIAPHIPLVFPFHSRLTLDQLSAHVQKVVRRWAPFPVVMHGAWSAQNEFVGLATQVGRDALTEMHDRLYLGPLGEFLRPEFEYEPHMTLARATQLNQFEAFSRAATLITRNSFRDVLRKLTVVNVDTDSVAVVEREIYLQH